MVALRSLFLAGLVVAVNSKREMKNEDENQVGFTPVSKITFLQSAPGTIASMKAEVERDASAPKKPFTFETWNLGTDDKKFIIAERKFAEKIAAKFNQHDVKEELQSFDVDSRLLNLKKLQEDTKREMKSLSVNDFQGPFWAAAIPRYQELEEEKQKLVAKVKVKDDKKDKERIKEIEVEMRNMDHSHLGYVTERYNTVWEISPKVVKTWEWLNGGAPLVSATSVDTQVKPAVKPIAERKEELAKIYLAGDTIPQWLKVVCGFAVGVVSGAFVYDVYTRKSDTVRAGGEGLV